MAKRHLLGRTTGEAAINVDLPISRRNRAFSALGNLSLNGNAEVEQLSDFGTLTTIGAGVNWSPVDRLNLLGSWTREEGPPTINQLGDPILETPGARIFDFTTGQTVLATVITGGNPDLQADRRTVTKLGANWQPFVKTDLRLRGEYVHQQDRQPDLVTKRHRRDRAGIPRPLPSRGSGQLISADLRPVNFESSQRDTLRIGFDFSKPLKSQRPSQAVIDQMRAQFRRDRGRAGAATAAQPNAAPAHGATLHPPEAGALAPPKAAAFRRRRLRWPRWRGRAFGGGNRGRVTFSLTDTITFVDKVQIGPGLPEIDYLHGDAAGQSGGTPRHLVEAQAGYFNNGLGARLSANWRSGTRVNTLTGDDLRFSPLATFDLRLFANPGDIPELAVKHPWLRGTQVQLRVNNIFDSQAQGA